MTLSHRLSSSMFERPEENQRIKPNRIIFLSVEGTHTEKDYFRWVEKYKDKLGIDGTLIQIEVLSRSTCDTKSDPQSVVELLEEYLKIRDETNLPYEIKQLISNFSEDFIRTYFEDDTKLDAKEKKNFQNQMQFMGYDIAYTKYLQKCGSTDNEDVFGIVIDRDSGSRSKEDLLAIVKHCEEKHFQCYLSNPCFDFWLLLHLSNIKNEFKGKEDELLKNKKLTNRHTYISKEISDRAHHKKKINEKIFCKYYLKNIDTAIERSKDFERSCEKIISYLGSNLPDLFCLLREKRN